MVPAKLTSRPVGGARCGVEKGVAISRPPMARTLVGRAGYGGCVQGLLAGVSSDAATYCMKDSLFGIASVAYKEFLHIVRDRRIMVLVLAFNLLGNGLRDAVAG